MKILKYTVVLFFLLGIETPATGQEINYYFGDRCEGEWYGILYLYDQGTLKDSLGATMEIERLARSNSWKWKTSFNAKPEKIIKDYVLKLIDVGEGIYEIDEGDGIKLNCYQYGDKLYSTFSVGESLLTAIYEIKENTLFFEITSNQKENSTGDGTIYNYSVKHVQKVALWRK